MDEWWSYSSRRAPRKGTCLPWDASFRSLLNRLFLSLKKMLHNVFTLVTFSSNKVEQKKLQPAFCQFLYGWLPWYNNGKLQLQMSCDFASLDCPGPVSALPRPCWESLCKWTSLSHCKTNPPVILLHQNKTDIDRENTFSNSSEDLAGHFWVFSGKKEDSGRCDVI